MSALGSLSLPSLTGIEISPGVWLMGEPTPVAGSNKLRCLADVHGALCVVELSMKFNDAPAAIGAAQQEN